MRIYDLEGMDAFKNLSIVDKKNVLEVLGAMKKGEVAESVINCLSHDAAKLVIDIMQNKVHNL